MSAAERREGNGTAAVGARRQGYGERRLRLNPNTEHRPERYDDVRTEFDPAIFSSLERHLPPSMLAAPRDSKVQFMRDILARYLPDGERSRVHRHMEYRRTIMSEYQGGGRDGEVEECDIFDEFLSWWVFPHAYNMHISSRDSSPSNMMPLHKELYNMNPAAFFVPSFIQAINANTEESFRNIISEPSPGVYTFSMLQPNFCEMLLAEVENFEKWVNSIKFKIMRPNTMNKYGAVLDDFGLEAMLNKLMDDFICPISKVFFLEVGGSSLDTHHGFVVEYGKDRDVELGFHVDDSEVTLNVCLGKQFSGGELYFRGIRCDKHINSETQPEEIFDYHHVPGQAVLHRGRHRHGARATTSGHRINLLLWCRSSVFREMKKYQKDFSSWCGECQREKKERQCQSVAATKLAFLRSGGGSMF